MALTRITKGVIKPNENYDTHNINSTGIVTSIGLDVNGNGDISGDLNVGGVLTYEDVTSIDSVGIITAQKDIHVGAGVSAVGVGTFGSLDIGGDIDVDGHTNLDNGNVAGIVTFNSGAALHTDGGQILLKDRPDGNSNNLFFGTGGKAVIFHDGTNFSQVNNTGHFFLGQGVGNKDLMLYAQASGNVLLQQNTGVRYVKGVGSDASVQLFFNNNLRLNTTNAGVSIPRDLDVDGHTNLDNVNVGGATTTTGVVVINAGTQSTNKTTGALRVAGGAGIQGNVNVGGDLDVDGHTNLDNVSIAGVSTFSGILDATNTPASIRVAQDIQHKGDADTKITFPAADTVSVETGGSERVRITSAGSVGINTTSPNRRFTLYQDATTRMNLKSLANSTVGIEFGDPDDENIGYIVYDNTDNSMAFGANAGQRLRIDSSGRLLIGTTTEGHANADDLTIATTGHTGITLRSATNRNGSVFFSDGTSGADEYRGWIQYTHTSDYLTFGTNADERLRIASDGDVSIGSAADALRRVDIVGNSLLVRPNTSQYNSPAGNANAVNNSIIIRMPYGENAASTSNAGARFGIQFTGANNTVDHTSLNWADDPYKSASIYGVSEDNAGYSRKVGMAFYTSAFDATQTERLRITSAGLVGIGTDNPGSQSSGANNLVVAEFGGEGGITIKNDTNSMGHIFFADTDATAQGRIDYGHSGDYMRFYTANNERLRIDSSGRLLVNGATNNNAFSGGDDLIIGNTSSGTRSGITLVSNSSEDGGLYFSDGTSSGNAHVQGQIVYDHSGNFLRLYTSANERLRITSSGTVNIGGDYTSTTSRLRINTTSYPETTEYLAVFKAGVANGNRFKNRYIKIRNNYTGSVHGGVPIVWESNADGSNNKAYGAVVTEGNGDIRFLNAAATSEKAIGTDLLSTISEKLRITSDGFVGINESNPKTGLTIGKFGDYNNYDGNTYYMPVGKWASAWNAVNAIDSNTDYWVGFVGGYHKSGNSVNISLAPNRGNLNAQQGMYISGEATAISGSDIAMGYISGGSGLGAGTSGNVRATKVELLRLKSDGRLFVNSTAVTNTDDFLTIKRPAGSHSVTSMTLDATTSTASYANALIFTKAKDYYYNGIIFTSSQGHQGGICGKMTTNGGSTPRIDFRIGGSGFNSSDTLAMMITSGGHLTPGANNARDLGSTSLGWRNIYTNDLNLSNLNGEKNDIDGTQGSWTIQEGKNDLYIINRLNGKKFKIKMEEIS